ncbi:MAG: SDR family oxidoreductase [Cyclobacteriaceae bacterium]
MSKVSGKVVWITGASSGIGEALVYELAKKGAKLIISSRRKEELERVKGNCIAHAQPDIRVLPLDLSESSTLPLSAEAAMQLFGHVDILINNGGISQRSLAKDTTIDVDRKVMEIDYFGTVTLSKALIPHFIKRKSGHFVTISSVLGLIGTPYRSGYAAAKHALHGFFDSLRAELWKESKNIHVSLICPGWIRTNVTINALTGDGSKLNHMDPTTDHGMLPEVFAKKMIREIEAKTEQVFIGGMKERMAIYMMQYFPRVFSKIVRKAKVR